MKIAIIGTGYVGLVTGACLADAGHVVYCVDKSQDVIEILKSGNVPIYEPGLADVLLRTRSRLNFTTHASEAIMNCSVLFVCVGTPETNTGEADLTATFEVLKEICEKSREKKFLVLKSTVPVGAHRKIQDYCEKNCRFPIEVVNNPEFLKEGAAVEDFMRPDRIVIGTSNSEAQTLMTEIYEPFVKNNHPILFMSNASAELTKYAANAFLSVKISFINELARLADLVGADINEVRKGFTSDARINPAFFYPGLGYGGSCFPKDVKALVQVGESQGLNLKVVRAADQANGEQRELMFEKIKTTFNDNLDNRVLAIWGLSFKPQTDDVREAPALYLIRKLVERGVHVRAFDPVAHKNARKALPGVPFEITTDAMEAAVGADALVIATEWYEFRSPDFVRLRESLRQPIIFDGRNIFDPLKMNELGFQYHCFGRQIVTESKRN